MWSCVFVLASEISRNALCDIQEGCLKSAYSSENCTLCTLAPFFLPASHIAEMTGGEPLNWTISSLENNGLILRKTKQKDRILLPNYYYDAAIAKIGFPMS